MVRFPSAPRLLLGLLLSLASAPALAADGAQLFEAQCKICHSGPSTALAPSLAGVAGAKIAGRDDFAYSPGLKAKDGTWTDENLDTFLKGPAAFAPGTKMFIEPQSDENRAALIEYLKTLKPDPPKSDMP
jgi:cytochrome c